MEATTAYTGQMGVEQSLDDVRFRLARSRAVTVLTGSGISADSGIPTFRGTDGLWNTFRAEDLATPEAFARDPYLVWKWYNWRRELIAGKQPRDRLVRWVGCSVRTNIDAVSANNAKQQFRCWDNRDRSDVPNSAVRRR